MKIITVGDERLKQTSRMITDYSEELSRFIEHMFASMAAKKGIGLAAVQVGRLTRVFITHIPEDGQRVFCNPEIIGTSEEQMEMEEGCLSVPKIYEQVVRPTLVRVQAFTEKGKPFTMEAHGMQARVIQHELDHLNGILFIDRVAKGVRERIDKSMRHKPTTARI